MHLLDKLISLRANDKREQSRTARGNFRRGIISILLAAVFIGFRGNRKFPRFLSRRARARGKRGEEGIRNEEKNRNREERGRRRRVETYVPINYAARAEMQSSAGPLSEIERGGLGQVELHSRSFNSVPWNSGRGRGAEGAAVIDFPFRILFCPRARCDLIQKLHYRSRPFPRLIKNRSAYRVEREFSFKSVPEHEEPNFQERLYIREKRRNTWSKLYPASSDGTRGEEREDPFSREIR